MGAALALTLGACGGGDTTSTGSPAPLPSGASTPATTATPSPTPGPGPDKLIAIAKLVYVPHGAGPITTCGDQSFSNCPFSHDLAQTAGLSGPSGTMQGRQSVLCFCAVTAVPHLPANPTYTANPQPWGGTVTVNASITLGDGSADPFTYILTINEASPDTLEVNDIRVQTPRCTADIYSAVNDC